MAAYQDIFYSMLKMQISGLRAEMVYNLLNRSNCVHGICFSGIFMKQRNFTIGHLYLPLGTISIIPSMFSSVKTHQLYLDLPREYGKILSIQIGPLNIVWLNNASTIEEAFVGKGEVISDRTYGNAKPVGFSGTFASYSGFGFFETNYGPTLKGRRCLALRSLMINLDENFAMEAGKLTDKLSGEVTKSATAIHNRVIHMAVANGLSKIVFGRRFDYNDATLTSIIDAIFVLFRGRKVAQLKHIPFAGCIPAIRRWFEN